jgi:hypothetical protein
MYPNVKLKFVLTSTYGFKIKHRRVVISSLVSFLIFMRNNARILRTGCQVRKAVLSGTPELGGEEGQPPPLPFTRGGKGALQFKGLPWRNRELSEMLVQFFYEFASENARNAVIELQE